MNKKDEKFLQLAMARFDECVTAESTNRSLALEDLKFRNGVQWPDGVRRDRELEGRPCLVLNRIPAFVRQVINDIRQTRPAIKVRPVDSDSDVETAEIMNGMIRAIEQSCNAEIAYDWAAEYAVTMGWGYIRVMTDYCDDMSFDQDIYIKRVDNPFTVYMDPGAKEPDKSDAEFAFVESWMDKKAFEKKYPDATSEWTGATTGQGKEAWFKDDAVRVAEYWVIEKESKIISIDINGQVFDGEIDGAVKTRTTQVRKVKQCIITQGEILETNGWPGKYIPIVPVLGEELNIEGETKLQGMVRDLRDPMRQYNYWRSASTERVALAPKAPFIGAKGQFESPKWRSANIKNHPYLEYNPVEFKGAVLPPPDRQPPPDVPVGMISEITMAADELKAVAGIFDPSLGNQSNEQSGVAINARQRRGDISNYHYVDNLGRALRQVGRIMVDLIPKIYDTARIVKIVGEDGEEESITVNEPFIDMKTQKTKHYDLQVGKYDVSVTIGPSYTTQRQEAADAMLEFSNVYPAAAPLIGDILAKNMDWPESDEIAKRLKTLLPPEIVQGENPQIAAILQQSQQEKAMLQDVIGQLQQELQRMYFEVQNKQTDNVVKLREQDRKEMETAENLQIKWADLELADRNKILDIVNKGVSKSDIQY